MTAAIAAERHDAAIAAPEDSIPGGPLGLAVVRAGRGDPLTPADLELLRAASLSDMLDSQRARWAAAVAQAAADVVAAVYLAVRDGQGVIAHLRFPIGHQPAQVVLVRAPIHRPGAVAHDR